MMYKMYINDTHCDTDFRLDAIFVADRNAVFLKLSWLFDIYIVVTLTVFYFKNQWNIVIYESDNEMENTIRCVYYMCWLHVR